MKKMIALSLVAATMAFGATSAEIADLQKQIDELKGKVSKVNAQSAGDYIKWGVDFRTAIDNINYDMADGSSQGNPDLMSMRLWLNMAYAADSQNIFKGQLSMNKAFGADFMNPMVDGSSRAMSMGGSFDWTGNEALTDNSLKVKEAYWLYLGDDLFNLGQDIAWTFSVGRRPSTNGFIASLSQDDPDQSPLGHSINVEYDGFSSKVDLSKLSGVAGMNFKLCVGKGSTNAVPLFNTYPPSYSADEDALKDITLGGFIFEPYNDGQFIVKTMAFRAFNLPGYTMDGMMDVMQGIPAPMEQFGNIDGAVISVLVDGLAEDGMLAETKVFGSLAWSQTNPEGGEAMLGSTEDESGTSYWLGAYLPVAEYGTVGLEYNHGSEYWRPFTYAEDTMIGSKVAARGDAFEINWTYQLTKALSLQARYVDIDYEYTGSNGFFGAEGAPMKIEEIKEGAAMWSQLGGTADPASGQTVYMNLAQMQGMDPMDPNTQTALMPMVQGMGMASAFAPSVVEAAQDFRFYVRYRF